MTAAQQQQHHEQERARSTDEQASSVEGGSRPTVHYPVDVKRAPSIHEPHPGLPRFETMTTSRASSIAGTDDEDDGEDYDWSGEDDLVDEEAKFEQKMGIKQKRKGWGFKR
jgi:hypothetical protein